LLAGLTRSALVVALVSPTSACAQPSGKSDGNVEAVEVAGEATDVPSPLSSTGTASTADAAHSMTTIAGASFARDFRPLPATKWPICRSSTVPQGARLGYVMTILGRDDLFRLGDDAECRVEILEHPADLSLAFETRFADCTIAFDANDGVVDRLQFATDAYSPEQLQKCLFRLGLWADGHGDVIVLNDRELFIPVSQTHLSMIPRMPDVVPVIPRSTN
jgi:hypothetical protein